MFDLPPSRGAFLITVLSSAVPTFYIQFTSSLFVPLSIELDLLYLVGTALGYCFDLIGEYMNVSHRLADVVDRSL